MTDVLTAIDDALDTGLAADTTRSCARFRSWGCCCADAAGGRRRVPRAPRPARSRRGFPKPKKARPLAATWWQRRWPALAAA